jgi:hypothetical protein
MSCYSSGFRSFRATEHALPLPPFFLLLPCFADAFIHFATSRILYLNEGESSLFHFSFFFAFAFS